MSINGIETILWASQQADKAAEFFVDFGLPLFSQNNTTSHFRLAEGSNVIVLDVNAPELPTSSITGGGVREVIWGVDNQQSLDALVADLRRDRSVEISEDGTARFLSDAGLAFGLRIYPRKTVVYAPSPVNAAGNIQRLNQSRKWRHQARPKTMNHVVFLVKPEDMATEVAFLVQRLGFRITDVQDQVGTYMRASGTFEHHSILIGSTALIGENLPACFNHVAFGVEDIDELMVGNNVMARNGWDEGFLGMGRHRIASALHSYWKVPGGAGEAEFSGDTDYVDDNWLPRKWGQFFGQFMWLSSLANVPTDTPQIDVEYLGDISLPPKQTDK